MVTLIHVLQSRPDGVLRAWSGPCCYYHYWPHRYHSSSSWFIIVVIIVISTIVIIIIIIAAVIIIVVVVIVILIWYPDAVNSSLDRLRWMEYLNVLLFHLIKYVPCHPNRPAEETKQVKLQLHMLTQQRWSPSTGKDQYLSITTICIKDDSMFRVKACDNGKRSYNEFPKKVFNQPR